MREVAQRGRMFRLLISVTALLYLTLAGVAASAATVITHNYSDAAKEELALEVLKLVLANDPSGTEYTYRSLKENVDEARLVEMLKDGSVNIMWAGAQESYERELIPIRIPVFQGLLGHRVFIIRKGDQPMFDQVETLEDLKKIPLGQGRFWGDTAILKDNGFNVVTAVKYEGLFHMLEGGRFDYFPRGVHEPWSEMDSRPDLNLTVEKNLLLVYPFAMYFFVAKDNPELAKAITAGFMEARRNGSYNELFFNHPVIKEAVEKSNLSQRKVFRIPNPNATPETPIDKEEFWLDLDDL